MFQLRLLILFFILLILCSFSAFTQIRVSGNVFDISKAFPLQSVSVLSTSGRGTITDSLGHYTIIVDETDSLYFSFLNKSTSKFPVKSIPNIFQFDISLHVPVTDLPAVQVKPRNYRFDSLQNRKDYAKVFNFKKPGIGISSGPAGGAGVGIDLDEFINIFRFRYNRRMLAFQKRLIQEEEDKFIDHRFTRRIVIKITGLSGTELDEFMKAYRPSYEFTRISSDYEFLEYIKLAHLEFMKHSIKE